MEDETSADGWCRQETEILDSPISEEYVRVEVWDCDGTSADWEPHVKPRDVRVYWVPSTIHPLECLRYALKLDNKVAAIRAPPTTKQ